MQNQAPGTMATYSQELQARRAQYLDWVVREFSRPEPDMKPLDGRLWSLNHARLATGSDLEKANRYFSQVALTRDADFMGLRLLKTLLDFGDSPRLGDAAQRHLTGIIRDWTMNDLSRFACWPRRHTENHDIMYLTIGLFSEKLRSESIEGHLDELRQSLLWRFERGFYEWNSHRYQFHYSNALQVLAVHAPAEDLREAAEALLNVLLAERALLSVGGYLGGPFMRGYDAERGCDYLDDNRYDAFLPTVWLAFGVGEPRFDYATADGLAPAGDGFGNGSDPRLNQDEGMFFATSDLAPHAVVRALLADVAAQPELVYVGKRATAGYPQINVAPSDWRTNQCVRYYNTPHISMGSLQWVDGAYPITSGAPSRWWAVTFPAEPSQVLRTAGDRSQLAVQHKDWLLAGGELSESHGLTARKAGPWNLYHVGQGLCAHVELSGWHVFQVSDTEKFPDEEAFVRSLSMPVKEDNRVRGITINGDEVVVDLDTMALTVNGTARPPFTDMLHDCPFMQSRYGSGVIRITTSAGSLTIDGRSILRMPDTWKSLPEAIRASATSTLKPFTPRRGVAWGNPLGGGAVTTVDHVRALGGMSPTEEGMSLRSVSVFLPSQPAGQIRLAVYAGGTLDGGPHAGEPAKLLRDFGKTDGSAAGWITLKHPGEDVPLPANEVVWVTWKGTGGKVSIQYQEHSALAGDFQHDRGWWDSKAVEPHEDVPWPSVWPAEDEGASEDYWYSVCLTYEQ